MAVLMTTDLPLPLFIRGKVRDTYDLGEYLLDHRHRPDFGLRRGPARGHPGQGGVLNQLSAFWFDKTAEHRAESSRRSGDRHGCHRTARQTVLAASGHRI